MQDDKQKPSPSKTASSNALRRIVGTALVGAGQSHSEPQMVAAGKRLLAKSETQQPE